MHVVNANLLILNRPVFNVSLQMIEADKLQVKELRQQGYSDGQLAELGFPKVAMGLSPAVLKSS